MFTMCHSALQYTRHLELILTRDDPLGVSVQPSSDLALGATSRGSMRSARVSSPSFATPAASVSASDDDPRYALAAADAARAALRALAAEALWTRDEALRARDEAEADAEALRARLAETREALIERDAEATSLRRKVRLLLRRAEANTAGRRARLPDADAREEHDHVEALAAAAAAAELDALELRRALAAERARREVAEESLAAAAEELERIGASGVEDRRGAAAAAAPPPKRRLGIASEDAADAARAKGDPPSSGGARVRDRGLRAAAVDDGFERPSNDLRPNGGGSGEVSGVGVGGGGGGAPARGSAFDLAAAAAEEAALELARKLGYEGSAVPSPPEPSA